MKLGGKTMVLSFSAKLNNVEPYTYFEDVLERMAAETRLSLPVMGGIDRRPSCVDLLSCAPWFIGSSDPADLGVRGVDRILEE
jgi:hypothetical protein